MSPPRKEARPGPVIPQFHLRFLYLAWLAAGIATLGLGWYGLGGAPSTNIHTQYVEGVVGNPQRINPIYVGLNDVDADLSALIFNGLTRIAGDGTVQPDLAERWYIEPDGLTYKFHLRPNVFWHDGHLLDAYDVAFTIKQVQSNEFRGSPTLRAAWTDISVFVDSSQALTIQLPAASASFLTRTALGVLPEHLLTGLDPNELFNAPFNQAPVGTGPYRLVMLDSTSAVLEPNTSYGPGVPGLSRFEMRFFNDHQLLKKSLMEGHLDAALLSEALTLDENKTLIARIGLVSTTFQSAAYTILYMNNQREPLNDSRLRRAIAASIDIDALLPPTMFTTGIDGEGPIVPGSWAYTLEAWPSSDNADDLFKAASWLRTGDDIRRHDDQPLVLEIITNSDPVREALAEGVIRQLRNHGVATKLLTMPASVLLETRIEPRDYELMIFGWETDIDPDPYGAWHTSQIQPPGRNVAGYHDAVADALMEAARTTLDLGERIDLYKSFTQRFAETTPSIVLQYPVRTYVHPSTLKGLSLGLLFEPASRFRDSHLWHIESPHE